MAKDNRGSCSGWMQFVHELFRTEIYKRSQGRLVRQFTCLAIWVAFALAAWRIVPHADGRLADCSRAVALCRAGVVLAVGLWLGFRIVNLPRSPIF